MGTNCVPSLADLFLHSYEAEFLQTLLKQKDKELAQSFNFTFRYIDDVVSLSNSRFGDYIHLICLLLKHLISPSFEGSPLCM